MASRIWYIDQKTAELCRYSGSQLRQMLRIIIDAGMIYFFTLLVALVTFVLQSNAQFVILDMVSYRSLFTCESDPPMFF